MQERVEQQSAQERRDLTHIDGAAREAYSDDFSAFFCSMRTINQNTNTLDFGKQDIYDQLPSSMGLRAAQPTETNEQAAELPERDSARLNREDDRQPYLDPERHQDA